MKDDPHTHFLISHLNFLFFWGGGGGGLNIYYTLQYVYTMIYNQLHLQGILYLILTVKKQKNQQTE